MRHYRILCGTALLVVLLDQLTKWIVVATIPEYRTVTVIPGFFDLVNIRNRGAAFGFLNRSDIEWQFWLFLVATVMAAWAIFTLARPLRDAPWTNAGLGLILGGALGNLVDRLRLGAVVDFLDFHVNAWHWPAFNLADTVICCGACFVCLRYWVTRNDPGPVPATEGGTPSP
jgi:signal peptidase II